jgi:hypothetical protein
MLKRIQLVFVMPIKNRQFINYIKVYYSEPNIRLNNRALQGETTIDTTEATPKDLANKTHPLFEDTPENEYKDDQMPPTNTSTQKWTEMKILKVSLDSSRKKLNILMAQMAKNIAGTTLKIRCPNWHTFKRSRKPLEYLQTSGLELADVNIFTDPKEEAIEEIAKYISSILVFIMWLCLIISPIHGISIIKVFQMADYLLFFNADTPSNLAAFLIIFSNTPFDSIPNPFNYFQATRGGTCSPPQKFEQNGVSCYILANIGAYVLQLACMFI